jgi:hypothetical protein
LERETMNRELTILQLVRLRGRPSQDDVVESSRLPSDAAGAVIQDLAATGCLQETRGRLRITPEGKERLASLIQEERASVDHESLASGYERFSEINGEFKRLVTDWQLIDGSPNDHSDDAYDATIISRLGELHERFIPLVQELAKVAPRLGIYPSRFEAALEKVQAGDHSWLARPMVDSYHTAWFELHEDLIGLLGLTRAEEAAAGRAE